MCVLERWKDGCGFYDMVPCTKSLRKIWFSSIFFRRFFFPFFADSIFRSFAEAHLLVGYLFHRRRIANELEIGPICMVVTEDERKKRTQTPEVIDERDSVIDANVIILENYPSDFKATRTD